MSRIGRPQAFTPEQKFAVRLNWAAMPGITTSLAAVLFEASEKRIRDVCGWVPKITHENRDVIERDLYREYVRERSELGGDVLPLAAALTFYAEFIQASTKYLLDHLAQQNQEITNEHR